MTVRVRFAPSPTGALHVGSARTALFNWFFAKHENGAFILRIEDTDQKRSDSVHLKDIEESLAFLGVRPDEETYFQSKRVKFYREQADKLLEAGFAKHQDGAIVFPVAPGQVAFTDLLRGKITVDTDLFRTIVLIKSDGLPAYNFACVVDDALMKISHVIRGDDHIANTPKQVVLYEALKFPLPTFVHIPLIVGADRARLSKREGASSVTEYKQAGYLSNAFVNYLALLGWSPGGDREIALPQEIIKLFDISKVHKTAAQFDQRKLNWLNGQYIRQMSVDELANLLAERLIAKGWIGTDFDKVWMGRITALIRDRLKTLSDIENEFSFFFQEPRHEEKAVSEFLRVSGIGERLLTLKEKLAQAEPFTTDVVERIIRVLVGERSLKPKELIHPTRVALTGKSTSPPLFELISILGKPTVLKRLEYAAHQLVGG